MILCCGEALIDFMPVKTLDGEAAVKPRTGGSVFNVAIALGRLGIDAGYFGGLSDDHFGDMLRDELANSHVDASLVVQSSRPSTLAFVHLNNGQAEYTFFDEASAARMLSIDQLPELPTAVKVLHFGSNSLINDPAASSFESLARREKTNRIISIDPNIRPSLVSDRQPYVARLQAMMGFADIIKISEEDLHWLVPGQSAEAWAQQWFQPVPANSAGRAAGAKVRLVVVTNGDAGSVAYLSDGHVAQKAEPAKVVDTVGAGDAFMAGLLASLENQRLLTPDNLTKISHQVISTALKFASRTAAITVSRAGANPPWHHEL